MRRSDRLDPSKLLGGSRRQHANSSTMTASITPVCGCSQALTSMLVIRHTEKDIPPVAVASKSESSTTDVTRKQGKDPLARISGRMINHF